MMDGPKDSGTTATPNEAATRAAAEDAAVNAPADEISPLDHEPSSTGLCRSKQISTSISDQDSATSDGNGSGDVPHVKEGPTAQVASPGSFQSSLDVQTPLTAETHGEGLLERTALDSDVAVTKKDASLSKLTENNGSSPPSSPSIESGKNLYTSFEPLVNEPRTKNNLRSYDAESEDTGDEQYRKNIDKGKGKEIASRIPDPKPVSPAEGQQGQPLNVPWVQDPERPPQKFPIRFTDCVGRNFVWPWKKAKTWKGAKRLVESAFLYVDVLGPHVFAGHYDLTIQGMWSDPKTAAINPTLASYPPATTQPSNSILSDNCINGIGAASSAPSSSLQPGLPPPPTNLFPHLVPKVAGRGAIILPELWEDVVEPGMLILMRMWPIAPSPSTHSHPHHMPVVPMPPPFHSHHGVGTGRGRGRGAGMGMGTGTGTATAGRGSTQQPAPQPGWQQPARRRGPPLVVIPFRPPKGKTRKRQDGL